MKTRPIRRLSEAGARRDERDDVARAPKVQHERDDLTERRKLAEDLLQAIGQAPLVHDSVFLVQQRDHPVVGVQVDSAVEFQ
jgi:hypothetical protein